jgi:hypothetical protein
MVVLEKGRIRRELAALPRECDRFLPLLTKTIVSHFFSEFAPGGLVVQYILCILSIASTFA